MIFGDARRSSRSTRSEPARFTAQVAALPARGGSRDLFDVRALLQPERLDPAKLRLGFVADGARSTPVDWRTVTASAVSVTTRDVAERLLPPLRGELVPDRPDVPAWSGALVYDCQRLRGDIAAHPTPAWKAANARQRRGLPG